MKTFGAVFFSIVTVAIAQEYIAIELPPVPNLGNTWDFQQRPIQAINDRGEILAVTGNWETDEYASYVLDGFRWRPILYRDASGVRPTSTVDLNNRGDLLFSWPFGTLTLTRGQFIQLPDEPVIFPSRMNDRGEVVGLFNAPGLITHVFLFSRGAMLDLGPASPDSVPLINKRGQVAFARPLGQRFAPLIVSRTKTNDIDTLGGWNAAPLGLNNRGDVVGISQTAELVHHAFAYIKGIMVDLQTPDEQYGEAIAINDRRTVLGWWSKDGAIGAFLYQDGKRREFRNIVVNGAEWDFIVPTTSSGPQLHAVINNSGLIAGYGRRRGKSVGYLLIPKFGAHMKAQ